jgi:outer membrane autotransporter protein
MLTPEAALSVDYFNQDSYSDGYRDIDATDRWSYQSRLGVALSVKKRVGDVVIKPELHAYWLHEFNEVSSQVGYSQVGGTERYAFSVQGPGADVVDAGVGLSTLLTDRVALTLGVDGQFSDSYEAVRVSGRLSIDF